MGKQAGYLPPIKSIKAQVMDGTLLSSGTRPVCARALNALCARICPTSRRGQGLLGGPLPTPWLLGAGASPPPLSLPSESRASCKLSLSLALVHCAGCNLLRARGLKCRATRCSVLGADV